MTKISYKRTGGILGRQIDTELDLNEMPEEESQELQRLILETNFFSIPQNMIPSASPDEYEYTVTVDAGNSHHTIQTSDANTPDSLRPLLEKLATLAKEDRSNTQGQ